MHSLQQHILYKLTLHSPRRYSELKPKEVEGNVFMYHLKTLMREDLVERQGSGYGLTVSGLRYADTVSLKEQRPRAQPKIVTEIACQNEQGEWLLFRRFREPFSGKVVFPNGKVHLGEQIKESALREFKEKTGLEATLTYRGDWYSAIYTKGELISHMLSHVFSGVVTGGTLSEPSEIGECFWSKIEALTKTERMPGLVQLIDLLEQRPEPFFEEMRGEV